MKRIVAASIILLLFVQVVIAAEFWGSKNSNKYHYPTCEWAQKIRPANKIVFKTPEDAKQANYIPCKVCQPPLAK